LQTWLNPTLPMGWPSQKEHQFHQTPETGPKTPWARGKTNGVICQRGHEVYKYMRIYLYTLSSSRYVGTDWHGLSGVWLWRGRLRRLCVLVLRFSSSELARPFRLDHSPSGVRQSEASILDSRCLMPNRRRVYGVPRLVSNDGSGGKTKERVSAIRW